MARKRKRAFKVTPTMALTAGAVGMGAYLLWRKLQKTGTAVPPIPVQGPVVQAPAVQTPVVEVPGVGTVPISQIPGLTDVIGQLQTVISQLPPAVTPDQPVDVEQPSYPALPTPVPAPVEPTAAESLEESRKAYLASIGNPKAGATVFGVAPPEGLFPPFKGAAGPKQKKCTKAGGVWTGPTGKKFCVMPQARAV